MAIHGDEQWIGPKRIALGGADMPLDVTRFPLYDLRG